MNITEGNDVNHVLNALLQKPPKNTIARKAAIRLAGRANKVLGAGLRAEDVEKRWPE